LRTRILTQTERHAIEKYLKANGQKPGLIRTLAVRIGQNLPQLKKDLLLVERFHRAYVKKNGTH
jgi:hypothetical protein